MPVGEVVYDATPEKVELKQGAARRARNSARKAGRAATLWKGSGESRKGRMGAEKKLASLCAGIDRHGVENVRVSQERSSDPP
jgi:hypothetical protein